MKWVRFVLDGNPQVGMLQGTHIKATSLTWTEVLQGRTPTFHAEFALDDVHLLAPLERPGKIIAIGLNYMDHCREQKLTPPESPLIFTKFTTAIIGTGAPIQWSSRVSKQVDYEAELAVVIGRTARNVNEANALDCVFGYTAANDVSARDLQFGDGQWVRGKSLDTFCPLGPSLVTPDELPSPLELSIRCEVNGQRLQDSNTKEMIFDVGRLISFCSEFFTLEAGDVLLTGTPHGVGVFREPKIFLKHGDQVVVEIEGIGRLENPCETTDGV